MKITDIKEVGCNNLLRWAIKNGADIKSDQALISLINDEVSYMVTFNDVTFFELFRLTQMYRDNLAIIATMPAQLPSDDDLKMRFPGEFVNPDDKRHIAYYKAASDAINPMINIALQMQSDDDIIPPSVPQLFLPMIARRYNVQIPFSFADLITSIQSNNEARELFNDQYPTNLNKVTVENPNSSIIRMLMLGFPKATSVIKYNKQYEKYLNVLKYRKIETTKTNQLYNIRLDGFFKVNPVTRAIVKSSLFNANKAEMSNTLKVLATTQDTLKVEFMVQLPLQYMQSLLNDFSTDEIGVQYESTMSNILSNGIGKLNFITYDNEGTEDEEKIKARETRLTGYRTRIKECLSIALNTIQALITSDTDADSNSIFALLPVLYRANALVTIDLRYEKEYLEYSGNPEVASMLKDMVDMANQVVSNINNSIGM